MKQFIFATALLACCVMPVCAADQNPPAVKSSPGIKKAVDLLDGYKGDGSDLEAARLELERALKANPRNAPAHREMARFYIMRGHLNHENFAPGALEAADAAIGRALSINSNYAEAYVLRGHLYRLMQRPADALAALQRAEKLGTNDPWLQNNWADLLIDADKFDEAALRYRKVIDSRTDNKRAMSGAISGLINYYVGTGKLDEADALYRQQLAMDPKSAWNYGNYAHFLLCRKDDYEGAIVRSREALQIMNYGSGRFFLAASLYRKWAEKVFTGGPDKGSEYFAEASAINPDIDAYMAYLADCPPLVKIMGAKAQSSQRVPGRTVPKT